MSQSRSLFLYNLGNHTFGHMQCKVGKRGEGDEGGGVRGRGLRGGGVRGEGGTFPHTCGTSCVNNGPPFW